MSPVMLLEAIVPEDVKTLLESIEKMAELKLGEVIGYILRFRHTDGRIIRSEYVSKPVDFNEEGRVCRIRSQVYWFEE